MSGAAENTEVTLGEVSRGLTRVEAEMRAGFDAISQEIKSLSFVPAAVYSADKLAAADRMAALAADFEEDRRERREVEAVAAQRAWQARWSIILAMIAMPISIIGAVLTALLMSTIK
jgi:hypothetical protein